MGNPNLNQKFRGRRRLFKNTGIGKKNHSPEWDFSDMWSAMWDNDGSVYQKIWDTVIVYN
jgi:hypothetical protein